MPEAPGLSQRACELSDRYANFMRTPTAGDGVTLCALCRTFISGGFERCYPCHHALGTLPATKVLDVMVPITFSPALGQMHTALRGYKDPWGGEEQGMNRLTLQLGAVLHRFLHTHEACVATAAQVEAFDLVTNVPSGTHARDEQRGRLRLMLEQMSTITRDRYQRALRPTDSTVNKRQLDPDRFAATESLDGARVLLVDDTWTTGSSALSAAIALRRAGAAAVGMVVIGRHVNPDWEVAGTETAELLKRLPAWSWETCAAHR